MVASNVATRFVVATPPVFLSARRRVTVSPGSMAPLPGRQFSASMVALSATMSDGPFCGVMENRPRPCVAATNLLQSHNSSSTATLAGPSLLVDQVAPPSEVPNTPTSVPTYSVLVSAGAMTMELTGATGKLLVMFDHVTPPSLVRQTLLASKPPKVT